MKRIGLTISSILVIAFISALAVVLFGNGNINGHNYEDVYATDITINTEFRSLTIYVGNFIEFKNDPYKITPSNYNLGVEIKILNYLDKEREDAVFKNNSFKASSTGAFYLRFYVKTKFNTTKFDTLKITVKDKPDNSYESITFKKEIITLSNNEEFNLSENIVAYNFDYSDIRYRCSKGLINGSIFSPKGIGSYYIEVYKEYSNYLLFNIFTINVTVDEEISINLYDKMNKVWGNGDTIYCNLEDEVILFSYIIQGMISQIVSIDIENDKIVSLISSDAPIIALKICNAGKSDVFIKIPNKDFYIKLFIIVQ